MAASYPSMLTFTIRRATSGSGFHKDSDKLGLNLQAHRFIQAWFSLQEAGQQVEGITIEHVCSINIFDSTCGA